MSQMENNAMAHLKVHLDPNILQYAMFFLFNLQNVLSQAEHTLSLEIVFQFKGINQSKLEG